MNKYLRKIFQASALVALCLIMLCGCSTEPSNRQNVKVGLGNSVLQLTPFQEHMLGHWVTESGKTHYYIGNGTIAMIDNGKIQKQKFTIYETNEPENFIRIQVTTEYNLGHKKLLRFSSDFKSISQTFSAEIMGKVYESSGKWLFVDSKTSP